ncbi:hypothetical protein ABPG75_005163 [Micractinium tetrahymenae]
MARLPCRQAGARGRPALLILALMSLVITAAGQEATGGLAAELIATAEEGAVGGMRRLAAVAPSAPADVQVTLTGTIITVKVKPGNNGGAAISKIEVQGLPVGIPAGTPVIRAVGLRPADS